MEYKSEILIYQTEDGITKIENRLLDETVWQNKKNRKIIPVNKMKCVNYNLIITNKNTIQ